MNAAGIFRWFAEAIPITERIHDPSLLGSAITRKVAAKQTGYDHVPVVAEIPRMKEFAYDTRGKTVNTASRVESPGEVGQVNTSESTQALVKNTPMLLPARKGLGEWEDVLRAPELRRRPVPAELASRIQVM